MVTKVLTRYVKEVLEHEGLSTSDVGLNPDKLDIVLERLNELYDVKTDAIYVFKALDAIDGILEQEYLSVDPKDWMKGFFRRRLSDSG